MDILKDYRRKFIAIILLTHFTTMSWSQNVASPTPTTDSNYRVTPTVPPIIQTPYENATLGSNPIGSQQTDAEKITALKQDIKNIRKLKKFQRRKNRIHHRSVSPFSLDSTKTIVYDFKMKEFIRSNVKPHINEPLVFKVININRIAYEVDITSENIAISDEFLNAPSKSIAIEPESLKKEEEVKEKVVTTPDFSASSQKNEKNADKSLLENDAVKITSDAMKVIDNEKDKLIKKEIAIDSLKVELFIEKNIDPIAIQKKGADSIAYQQEKLEKEMQNKVDYDNAVAAKDSIKAEIARAKDKLVEDLKAKKLAFKAAMVTFERLKDNYLNLLKKAQLLTKIENHYEEFRCLALNPILTRQYYLKLRRMPFFIAKSISRYELQIDDFQNEFNHFNSRFDSAMNDWELMDALESDAKGIVRVKYQQLKEEADKMKAKMDGYDLTSKLRKVHAIDRILYNEEGYQAASTPIQPLEDYVSFKVKIKNRDPKKQSEYEDVMEINHIEYAKGGVRFDFSTGIAFDFPLEKQDNDDDDYFDAYEISDVKVPISGVQTNIGKQIKGTSRNYFRPSLAGLFHTSFRTSNYVSLGLTLGASLNVEKFDLNSLYVGPSLLLGKKQKFIFTTGPAFKQMDILKRNYSLNQIYQLNELNDSSVVTSKQFRIGLFFAITYNLTQNQKSNFKLVK